MPIGTIKKLVRVAPPTASVEQAGNDGYGIIRGQDGRDVYFVSSAVRGCRFDQLASGQDVRYTVEEGPLGRAATVLPMTLSPSE
jgi:cold shock CspA family protein